MADEYRLSPTLEGSLGELGLDVGLRGNEGVWYLYIHNLDSWILLIVASPVGVGIDEIGIRVGRMKNREFYL